tara:strand:- start:622 stop:999 length:378 start_codon:yes stop_codon:yes gene_type:complete
MFGVPLCGMFFIRLVSIIQKSPLKNKNETIKDSFYHLRMFFLVDIVEKTLKRTVKQRNCVIKCLKVGIAFLDSYIGFTVLSTKLWTKKNAILIKKLETNMNISGLDVHVNNPKNLVEKGEKKKVV